jgi:XRE family transcriptional regulator, regulator of sulfur utilization
MRRRSARTMTMYKATDAERAQIAAAVKRTRERRGLTQVDVDRLVGASGSLTGQIERGRTSPSAAVLFKLARALDCSWSDLLGELPGRHGSAEWDAGYRAGVGDGVAALRGLLDNGDGAS